MEAAKTGPALVSLRGRGTALARTALVGNPSDGYGGAVLATTFGAFRAHAEARPAASLEITPPSELTRASVRHFARKFVAEAESSAVKWHTTIPRKVGLGGSSAIVIATLRALAELHRVELGSQELAACALSIERQDLGIAGGRQDQVAQACGGLTLMDFSQATPRCESLDQRLLPPLLLAYREDSAQDSGLVHRSLRCRLEGGASSHAAEIAHLASLAHRARDAVLARDHQELARCVDASFDARARMMNLDPRHLELIEHARASGASANYTGSGGAVVCVCANREHLTEVARGLAPIARVVMLDR